MISPMIVITDATEVRGRATVNGYDKTMRTSNSKDTGSSIYIKTIKFKLGEDPLQHRICFLTFVESPEMIFLQYTETC